MTSEEVDFWTPTIQAFAPLQLDKPELSPKLLKRPPFRFIHDIVASINRRFAAYDHIFRPDQMDAASIDSKEKKIEYLVTLVQYVGSLLGQKIDVNVKKIVSGSEPENTNVFLQCLALAVGYAQQDKAKKAQNQQHEEANTAAPSAAHGKTDSPSQQNLKPKSNDHEKAKKKEIYLHAAEEFYQKINGYGLFQLERVEPINVVGQSIVNMFNELQQVTIATQPTHLPVEALETAINRQIEAIQQVAALQEENSAVVESLEELL